MKTELTMKRLPVDQLKPAKYNPRKDLKYNDIFAVSLMKLLQEAGAQLPRDLGVIGFDNADVGAVFRPAMTTLGHPKEAFGALAAEKMLRMIAGEKEESQKMPWKLIERDSLPEVKRK